MRVSEAWQVDCDGADVRSQEREQAVEQPVATWRLAHQQKGVAAAGLGVVDLAAVRLGIGPGDGAHAAARVMPVPHPGWAP